MMKRDREDKMFWGWFAFIALLNVAFIGVLIYLAIEAAQWLGRQ